MAGLTLHMATPPGRPTVAAAFQVMRSVALRPSKVLGQLCWLLNSKQDIVPARIQWARKAVGFCMGEQPCTRQGRWVGKERTYSGIFSIHLSHLENTNAQIRWAILVEVKVKRN